MPSYSCSRRVRALPWTTTTESASGRNTRTVTAAVVRVRAEHVVGVAVAAVDHQVEDGSVEGEDLAHDWGSWGSGVVSRASCRPIRAIAPSGIGSQEGRLRAS